MVLLQSVCKVSVGSDFDIHKQFHVQKSTEHGSYALGDVGSMLLPDVEA